MPHETSGAPPGAPCATFGSLEAKGARCPADCSQYCINQYDSRSVGKSTPVGRQSRCIWRNGFLFICVVIASSAASAHRQIRTSAGGQTAEPAGRNIARFGVTSSGLPADQVADQLGGSRVLAARAAWLRLVTCWRTVTPGSGGRSHPGPGAARRPGGRSLPKRQVMTLTFSAWGPFWPCVMSNSPFCRSSRLR